MKVFAISDLHLSFSGAKPMDVFGQHWQEHAARVEKQWREVVGPGDVVCLPGDFSWALKIDQVAEELEWLGRLPGRKVLIKGNHDYWWASISKVRAALPEGAFALQNDSLTIDGVAFAGARGWVDPRLDFSNLSGHLSAEEAAELELGSERGAEEDRRIFEKELARLETSLQRMEPGAKLKVALLHYPPTSPGLEATEVTDLLEKYGVDAAVFGHVHRSNETAFENPFGRVGGVELHLASADFIDFTPVLLAEVE